MKRSTALVCLTLVMTALAVVSRDPVLARHRAGYHWAGSGDRNVTVIDSVTSDWDDSLTSAAATWSTSPVMNLQVQPGDDSKALRKKCPGVSNGIRVCNARYAAAWAGLANVRYDPGTGHIVRARARLNERFIRNVQQELAVTCHEIGHTLGLAHRKQGDPNTCLTPRLSTGTTPDEHDFEQLQRIHSHSSHASRAPSGETETVSIEADPAGRFVDVTVTIYPR